MAADDQRFAELTDQALDAASETDYEKDWLLANRAFTFAIDGNESEAYTGYLETRKHIQDRKRWNQAVMEDLRRHAERRPDALPIYETFIEKVLRLGEG